MKCPKCGNEIPADASICNFCGAILDEITLKSSVPPSMDYKDLELIRDKIEEKYEILEFVGKGGFSRVFKLKDKILERYCALKILSPELIKDEDMVERFKREAKLYSELEHPNIVPIYEVGFHNNVAYIIMKFVEGKTLKQIIKERAPLPLDEIISYSLDILSALDYMHRKGIIHRDIKPANIMVESRTGKAILTDFGLARKLDTEDFTKSGEILGTPHYLSPEQAKGLKLDARTDIYSFGITLFEMATGRLPFEGDNPFQILYKHTRQSIPDPSKFNPKIHPDLEKIILKATEKKPARRFQSALEMSSAIRMLKYYSPVRKKGFDLSWMKFLASRKVIPVILILLLLITGYIFKESIYSYFHESVKAVNSVAKKGVEWGISTFESIKGKAKNLLTAEKKPSFEGTVLDNKVSKKVGEVVFYAYPEAKVYLNGKYIGRVPPSLKVKLRKGKYRVRFEIPDYAEAEKELMIEGGEKMKLIQHIFPEFGVINGIVVNPVGIVYIDGKKIGNSPIRKKIKLSKGKHIIEITSPGYKSIRREIYIEAGENLGVLEFNLEKE